MANTRIPKNFLLLLMRLFCLILYEEITEYKTIFYFPLEKKVFGMAELNFPITSERIHEVTISIKKSNIMESVGF